MKKVVLIFLILCVSCESTKQAAKVKTESKSVSDVQQFNDVERETTETIETKRPGGSIQSQIIPESLRERDEFGMIKELVQELRDGPLTKTVYYKPDGTVDVDCTADEIWERIQRKMLEHDNSEIKRVDENTLTVKAKESEKETKTSTSFIWAGALAFVLIFGIFFFLLFKTLNQNTKAITAVLDRI